MFSLQLPGLPNATNLVVVYGRRGRVPFKLMCSRFNVVVWWLLLKRCNSRYSAVIATPALPPLVLSTPTPPPAKQAPLRPPRRGVRVRASRRRRVPCACRRVATCPPATGLVLAHG
jgi:hypothetical protein